MALSLACDDGTTPTVLRLEGDAAAVTWNDVWEYGAGSGNGTVAGDANGDAQVSDFMDEIVADELYKITKNVIFGDGTNNFGFVSKNELVYFTDYHVFTLKDNTEVVLGESQGDYGKNGSCWSVAPSGLTEVVDTGMSNAGFYMYDSVLLSRVGNALRFSAGVLDCRLSTLRYIDRGHGFIIRSGVDLYLDRVNLCSVKYFYLIGPTISKFNEVHVHYANSGIETWSGATVEKLKVTEAVNYKAKINSSGTLILEDPNFFLSSSDISIGDDNGAVEVKYTCNIHLTDEDGNDLEGVTVTCDNSVPLQVFSSDTDANGEISETILTYRAQGPTVLDANYNPFKFTFSKVGYKTLVMENVTVGEPVDWHVELQKPKTWRRGHNPGRLMIYR